MICIRCEKEINNSISVCPWCGFNHKRMISVLGDSLSTYYGYNPEELPLSVWERKEVTDSAKIAAGNYNYSTFVKENDVYTQKYYNIDLPDYRIGQSGNIIWTEQNTAEGADLTLTFKKADGSTYNRYYKYTVDTWTTVGLNYANGTARSYINKGGSTSSVNYGALMVAGEAAIGSSIKATVDFDFNLPLSGDAANVKVGIVNGYKQRLTGYVLKDGVVTVYAGGNMKSEFLFKGNTEYKLLDTVGEDEFIETSNTVSRYGNETTIFGWTYGEKLKDGKYQLVVTDKETPLSAFTDLYVNVYTADGGLASVALPVDQLGDRLKVEFKDGRYVRFENGKLVLDDNAVLYFEDYITFSVEGENAFAVYEKGSVACYLNKVTVKVVYDKDSKIQKEFRKVYKNYNESYREIFEDLIDDDDLLGEMIVEGSEEEKVYTVFVTTYIDTLFETVSDYRAENGTSIQSP